MRREEILEILQNWNFWNQELESGKERHTYIDKFLKLLDANIVVAVLGARRSGKSFIMRQAAKALIDGGVDRKGILFVNFEDSRFVDFYPKLMDEIYDAYRISLSPGKKPFVFLDEVHNLPRWERWARSMHELGKAKVVVSGSSSKLLSGELATSLTGRHIDLEVFPLSFKEFLGFRQIGAGNELEIAANRILIRQASDEYIEFGGFPEVCLSSEKKQMLLTYFDDMLTKDIERRYKLRKAEKLRVLARFYLTNIGNPMTFNSLKKMLGTTPVTIDKFSSYLEEAYMVFFLKRFHTKVKEHDKAARKVYAIDTGLANAVGFKLSSNIGNLAENVVMLELKRRNPNQEMFFWRDVREREVDFVVKDGPRIEQLIQVCWDIDAPATYNRETKALLKGGRELGCRNLLIITDSKEAEEKIKGRTIRFMPLWKWLLA